MHESHIIGLCLFIFSSRKTLGLVSPAMHTSMTSKPRNWLDPSCQFRFKEFAVIVADISGLSITLIHWRLSWPISMMSEIALKSAVSPNLHLAVVNKHRYNCWRVFIFWRHVSCIVGKKKGLRVTSKTQSWLDTVWHQFAKFKGSGYCSRWQ